MIEAIKYLIGPSNASEFVVASGFAFLLVCGGVSLVWWTVKRS